MSETQDFDRIVRLIRGTVCRTCYQRPLRSERLENTVARSCETGCPIFAHLPALYAIAAQSDTTAPGAVDRALRNTICSHCRLSPSAGDYCSEYLNRTCPLSRFAGEIVTMMEAIRGWKQREASPR